jgi:hypothetical protein
MPIQMTRTTSVGNPSSAPATSEFGKAVQEAAKNLVYCSEGDYPVLYVEHANLGNKPVSCELVHKLFGEEISKYYREDGGPTTASQLAWSIDSSAQTKKDLAEFAADEGDDGKAWGAIASLFDKNLTDLHHVRFGQKGSDGHLETDAGLYVDFIVGKTHDGKLAGVTYGAVET